MPTQNSEPGTMLLRPTSRRSKLREQIVLSMAMPENNVAHVEIVEKGKVCVWVGGGWGGRMWGERGGGCSGV